MTTTVKPGQSGGRRVVGHRVSPGSLTPDIDAFRTYTLVDSPLGPLTLVALNGDLTGLYLADHLHCPDRAALERRVSAGFEEASEQLDGYFAGRRTEFTLRTRPAGTEFQRRVWAAVKTIPYGQTRAYSQIAGAIGRPDRLRAVAAAISRNPLALVVPCHRVIGANGSLTGFAGGLDRKRFLLGLEGLSTAQPGCLF
jgi:methylated-DNA-[protein]-cysteine S-methyltransferase